MIRLIMCAIITVADLEIYMNPLLDTIIIREVLTVVIPNVLFAHNYGEPFDPVNGTDAINLNFTLFFSDRECEAEDLTCGQEPMLPSVDKEHLQVGSDLAQIQAVNLTASVLIPEHACNDTKYLCVWLERGGNSTYVEADDSNNLHCRSVEDQVVCQPRKHEH